MSNSKQRQNHKSKHDFRLNTLGVMALLAVGALAYALADLSVSVVKSKKDARIHQGKQSPLSSSQGGTRDPLWPMIKEVAEQFICGCGQCGGMALVECVCPSPNGGTAEKRFIREQLVAGHSKDNVIAMVQARFGHRAPPPFELKPLDSKSTESGKSGMP